MAVAEDQLQAVALGVEFNDADALVDFDRQPLQPKRPALRAWALASQLNMIQPLLTTIRPAQSQLLFAL
jgi:hypothetical protein